MIKINAVKRTLIIWLNKVPFQNIRSARATRVLEPSVRRTIVLIITTFSWRSNLQNKRSFLLSKRTEHRRVCRTNEQNVVALVERTNRASHRWPSVHVFSSNVEIHLRDHEVFWSLWISSRYIYRL